MIRSSRHHDIFLNGPKDDEWPGGGQGTVEDSIVAWPIRSVPIVPRTALAQRQPPYMAPVTEGKKASDPAR